MNTNDIDEITREYPWNTPIADVGVVEQDGKTYVPFISNVIDPELAARRTACKEVKWGPKMCRPARYVVFRPSTCSSVTSLGRLGR